MATLSASSGAAVSTAPSITTETLLEQLSVILAEAWTGSFGQEGYDFMRQHSAPNFVNESKAWQDHIFPHATNLEDLIMILKTLRPTNPEWRAELFNFTAQLNREKDHAIVWFTSGASGNPGSSGEWRTNRESAHKMYWRKREGDGEWEAYKHVCIRGGGGGSDVY